MLRLPLLCGIMQSDYLLSGILLSGNYREWLYSKWNSTE